MSATTTDPAAAGASTPAAEPDPDAIAAVVLACDAVAGLSGGLAGEIASYLPGRQVTGVQVRPEGIAVHVVAHYGPTMAEVAAEITAAVRAVAGPVDVRVGIDDLLLP